MNLVGHVITIFAESGPVKGRCPICFENIRVHKDFSANQRFFVLKFKDIIFFEPVNYRLVLKASVVVKVILVELL
mgnify:CR=1 FL=1